MCCHAVVVVCCVVFSGCSGGVLCIGHLYARLSFCIKCVHKQHCTKIAFMSCEGMGI